MWKTKTMLWPTKKLGEIIRNIVKNIEKSPTKRFIGLIVFLVSSSIIIFNGINSVWNFYYQKIQWKQREYEIIKSLASDVNIVYFESKLGRPTFINAANKTNKPEIRRKGMFPLGPSKKALIL